MTLFVFSALLCWLASADYVYNVPYEHYYNTSTVSESYTEDGCRINKWIGTCAVGLYGYQYVSTIVCDKGKVYHMAGINDKGEFNLINMAGDDIQVAVQNGDSGTLSVIGDYIWISTGSLLEINITGSAYIFGGDPTLLPEDNKQGVKPAAHADKTIVSRMYKILEGHLGHDPHINNGNAVAYDVTYSTENLIDPPYVLVMDCTNGSRVANHFHPWNAMYFLLTPGKLYFLSEDGQTTLGTSVAGYPRWVSAALRYNELITLEKYKNEKVRKLLKDLGIDGKTCPNPVLFSVTNFDSKSPIGTPVFDTQVSDFQTVTPTRMVSIVVAH